MKHDKQHRDNQPEPAENLNPEKQGHREEGASWAHTPEDRAKESVFASFQENPQALKDRSETPKEAAVQEPSTSERPESEAQSFATTYPSAAPAGHSYDPHFAERYDIYQYRDYDPGSSADDLYLEYPHLYDYDAYYQDYSSANQTPYYPEPSYLHPYTPAAPSGYDPFDFGNQHQHAWERTDIAKDEMRASDPVSDTFVPAASVAAGAIWMGEESANLSQSIPLAEPLAQPEPLAQAELPAQSDSFVRSEAAPVDPLFADYSSIVYNDPLSQGVQDAEPQALFAQPVDVPLPPFAQPEQTVYAEGEGAARLTINQQEESSILLPVNQEATAQNEMRFIISREIGAEPAASEAVRENDATASLLHSPEDSLQVDALIDPIALLHLQKRTDRIQDEQESGLHGLIADSNVLPIQETGPAASSEKKERTQNAETFLNEESEKSVLLPHETKGEVVGQDKNRPEGAGIVAGAVALGAAGLVGKAAVAGAKTVVGLIDFSANRLLREDEDLSRVADTEDVVREAVINMQNHEPVSDRKTMASRFVSKKLAAEDHLNSSESELADEPEVILFAQSKNESAEDLLSPAKEKPTSLIAKAPPKEKTNGLKQDGTILESNTNTEQFLLDEKKDPLNLEKKPATERERAAENKKATRKSAKKEKNESVTMSVIKSGKKAGTKGVLFVTGAAKSSAKKLVASKNEELAAAMSMANKSKKAVRGVKLAARVPIAIYRQARHIAHAIGTAVKSVIHATATLTAMGPVGGVIALAGLLLFMVLIAVLLGAASIINDEQEVSEVSALVAELDENLTEEINELGDQPILYLDASGTYNEESDDGKTLTKDADLADQESDLKEVTASSVTVFTDPGEVAAYIDAKYTGNWQVGAASWKYTVDAFGESWNIIEWDDMPEWAWKALNKVNRVDFKVTLRNQLKSLLMEEFDLEESLALEIGSDTADEFATVIYDNQIQGINEEILMQIIKDCVKEHKSDLNLSKDQTRKLYYQMQQTISDLIGEEDPFAFVYDEITVLHERMNYWSEKYDSFDIPDGAWSGVFGGSGSGSDNKYGYPNSSGYDEDTLAEWDGYNEVSVYGISESGTTSVTADGTRISNTWDDDVMGIACEGLQNSIFAYWSSEYKNSTGSTDGEPVKITLFNPRTNKTVTAEVIDCGGWRGYNPNFDGMNPDRQWDLLPAVWRALGGSKTAGAMKVYWKVDPDATVGGAALEPKTIEGYPWPKETDEENGAITVTRPTLVVHNVHDALNNDPLMEEIIDKDSFATEAEFKIIKTFVATKVKDVMEALLTMENSEGEKYTDYLYFRRFLGNPFGEDKNGDPHEWVIVERFNPGYEDFEHDDAYVVIRPTVNTKSVKAILEGKVEKIKDGEVTIRTEIDTANSSEVVYSELKDIKVEEGDEIKEGKTIGTLVGVQLKISYYEINDAALQIETKKDWAYDPGLYMLGFAGYDEPNEPEAYVGGGSDYSGCETVVEYARSRLGCPYVWGATGPDTFDCSGLTQWCYAQCGISIPRNSEAQHNAGKVVSLKNLKPGDVLWKPGHVGIFVEGNTYIHAPKPGDVVKASKGIDYFEFGLRF